MKIITSFDEGSNFRLICEVLGALLLAVLISVALAVSAGAEEYTTIDTSKFAISADTAAPGISITDGDVFTCIVDLRSGVVPYLSCMGILDKRRDTAIIFPIDKDKIRLQDTKTKKFRWW